MVVGLGVEKLADFLIAVITILLTVITAIIVKGGKKLEEFIVNNKKEHERINTAVVRLEDKITALKGYEIADLSRRIGDNRKDVEKVSEAIFDHERRITKIELDGKINK